MTLISHMTIAYLLSCFFNLNPTLAIIGSIFPDLIETPFALKHRKESHEIFFTLIFTFFVFFIFPKIFPNSPLLNYLKAFTLGYASHILLDALTISGVYFFPLKKRICLAPFLKIKTASFSEFIFIALSSTALGILILIKPILVHYLSYSTLHKKGIIDKKEFLEGIFNR